MLCSWRVVVGGSVGIGVEDDFGVEEGARGGGEVCRGCGDAVACVIEGVNRRRV